MPTDSEPAFVEIGPDDTGIKRINVAVAQEAVEALQCIIGREEINLSEAVRRLVEYGALVYREIRVAEHQVVIRGGGCDREVLLT